MEQTPRHSDSYRPIPKYSWLVVFGAEPESQRTASEMID